jgi:acetyl esterase/lipase
MDVSVMLLVLTASALAQTPPSAAPQVHRNLPYAQPANERQMLDVYAPAGARNRPVVFWIHGGGWQRGDKGEMHAKPQAFVDKGFVFATTNYRFIPHVTMQDIAGDVAKSIRWMYDHAAEYGGDPQTMFVMGWSAGGQLAALVCTDERYLKAVGLALSNIKGCVPVDADTFYPALQVDTVEARPGAKRPSSYRTKFPEGSDRELSSVLYVAKDKGIPPFLILHIGGRPESGTAIQALVLANALQVAGIPVRVFAADGKTHNTLDADLGIAGDASTLAVFEFVEGILKKRGPSLE